MMCIARSLVEWRALRWTDLLTFVVVALVILIFLDARDTGTPFSEALARAAEQALGPGATVAVRALTGPVPERELIDAGRAENAAAIARLTWNDRRHSTANLEIHVFAGDRRPAQTLTFEARDPLDERGRAVGLVLAALLASDGVGLGEGARGPPPPEAPAAPAAPVKTDLSGQAPPTATVAIAKAPSSTPPRGPTPGGGRWFLDAAVESGIAVGGAGSGFGGAVGLGRRLTDRLRWRLGARARFGDVGEAQASALSAGLAAGLGFTARRAAERERLEVDLHLNALLLYEALSHFSSDDVDRVQRGRFLPGASLAVEAVYWLAPGAGVFLGAGPEVAFGRTDVVVHLQRVAELVPLRVSICGGLRMTF